MRSFGKPPPPAAQIRDNNPHLVITIVFDVNAGNAKVVGYASMILDEPDAENAGVARSVTTIGYEVRA